MNRKGTFRLYPNAAQAEALDFALGLHCRLYNSALEQRIEVYQFTGETLTFVDQCKDLTIWRNRSAALAALNAQSCQVTLKRLALAMDAFFRRVKNGETPGFPRFKSFNRYPGWGYKSYGDGWKFSADGKKLRLSGIGEIAMRGKVRFKGTPKTCEILKKQGKWHGSVTYEVEPEQLKRDGGKQSGSFDWDLEKLLTIFYADGHFEEIDNPRWLRNCLDEIQNLQRVISKLEQEAKARSGKDKGFPVSRKLKRLYQQLAKLHSKIARQRHDFYHKLANYLVSVFGFLVSEELAVKNMTKSAKGTVEKPGKKVAQKAGLNREILATAPATLLKMIGTKAEEAGTRWALLNTRRVKPTQRCSCCGQVAKKQLSERMHICAKCGYTTTRDRNAAQVMLRYALEGEYWSGTGHGAAAPETPIWTQPSLQGGFSIWHQGRDCSHIFGLWCRPMPADPNGFRSTSPHHPFGFYSPGVSQVRMSPV